jgi:hypothetical protein
VVAILSACFLAPAVGWAAPSVGKDLSIEISQPHQPAQHTRRRGPVVVSLVPVGPSVLKIGAPIGFQLTSSARGYAHLYALDPSGKTQVWLENVRIRAHRPLTYPLAGFTVRAAPPAGDETIVFVVSRRPINGFAGHGTTHTPFDAQIPPADFHNTLTKKMSALPARDWVSTKVQLRVEE